MPLVMPLVGRKFLSVVVGVLVLAPDFGQEASGSPSDQSAIQSNSESNADLSAVVEYLTELMTNDDPDWHMPKEPVRVTIDTWPVDARTDKIRTTPITNSVTFWRDQGRSEMSFRGTGPGGTLSEKPLVRTVGKGRGAAWSDGNLQIHIEPPNGDIGGKVDYLVKSSKDTLSRLHRQGLRWLGRHDGLTLESIAGDASGWSVVWSIDARPYYVGVKVEGRGGSPGDVRVDRIYTKRAKKTETSDEWVWFLSRTCRNHQHVPWADGYVAGELTAYDGDGVSRNRFALRESVLLSKDQFLAAVAPPDPAAPTHRVELSTDTRGIYERSWVRMDDEMVEMAPKWQYRKLAVPMAVVVACLAGLGMALVYIRKAK